MAGHEEIEHEGELRLHLFAATRDGLFVEAARALARIMADDGDDERRGEAIVEVTARDAGGLLVDFVNELVYLAESRGSVAAECVVEAARDTALRARIIERFPRRWRTAVKAATYHDLAVTEGPRGFEASLVLDV